MAKVFKSGNGQAISIKKHELEEIGLNVGDKLKFRVNEDGVIVVTKDISMEEKWDAFFENGGTYDDYEVMELDEEMGREVW